MTPPLFLIAVGVSLYMWPALVAVRRYGWPLHEAVQTYILNLSLPEIQRLINLTVASRMLMALGFFEMFVGKIK